MTIKINGLSADALKHQARKLQKEFDITYHAALDRVSVAQGFAHWKHLLKNPDRIPEKAETILRPAPPKPAVVDCYDTFGGKSLGKRPNTRMPVSQHSSLGLVLQEVLNYTRYHKRANKVVNEIILLMDRWMGYEYNEDELPTVEFNQIYLGHRELILALVTRRRDQLRLKRKLREGLRTIEQNYHDCAPVRELLGRFEMALKMMDKWPTSIKLPARKERKTRLPAGSFVTKKGSKKLIMVFAHSFSRNVIEGFSDAGYFVAGRHEVIAVKDIVDPGEFKPKRLYVPYGKWFCEDGREVLFNRDYTPIWSRSKDGLIERIDPATKTNYSDREFYFDDRNAPYYYGNSKTLQSCEAILKEWGVEDQLPQIFDRFPEAIAAGDVGLLAPKGFS